MKPLETCQRVLLRFNMHEITGESPSRWEKLAYITCYSILLIGNTANLVSSAAFFVVYKSIDMERSLYAFAQVLALACGMDIVVITFFQRHRFAIVFDGLAKIYKECKYLNFVNQ